MDSLKELFVELQQYDFQADPQRVKGAKILRILDKVIEEGGAAIETRKPPLTLCIYAMKSILFPSFLPELMSELLHLLTMVEFYRLEITERASALLVWDTYHRNIDDPSGFSLTPDQRQFCETLESMQTDFRKIYLIIISQCCVMDLKRLWLASSNTHFWIRWNEYFSILNKNKEEESKTITHTFQYQMKPEDIFYLHEAACEIRDFMEATVQWAGDQSARGQSIQDVFESKDFQEEFPMPELSFDVLETIIYQLDSVQDAARTVVEIKSLQYDDIDQV